MNNIFYVYIYYDPVTKVPFYIGKGKGTRFRHHVNVCDKNISHYNKHLINKIKHIKKIGKFPIIKFYAKNMSEQQAFDKEMELISFYGRKDIGEGPLLNCTYGGEGTSGYQHTNKAKKKMSKNHYDCSKEKNSFFNKHHSEETKKKISIKAKIRNTGKNNPMYGRKGAMSGKHWSDEVKKKISIGNKGKTISEETRKKLSDINKGKTISEETKKKISNSLKGHKYFGNKYHSKETKKKMSALHKGSHHSEETKKKMSMSAKKLWAERKRKF